MGTLAVKKSYTARELLASHVDETGDPVIACTLTDEQLDHEFDYSRNSRCFGYDFVAWGTRWVYFTTDYDGMQIMEKTLRGPTEYAEEQIKWKRESEERYRQALADEGIEDER